MASAGIKCFSAARYLVPDWLPREFLYPDWLIKSTLHQFYKRIEETQATAQALSSYEMNFSGKLFVSCLFPQNVTFVANQRKFWELIDSWHKDCQKASSLGVINNNQVFI